jgi:hypothetical protein
LELKYPKIGDLNNRGKRGVKKDGVYKKRRVSIPDTQSLLTLNLIP